MTCLTMVFKKSLTWVFKAHLSVTLIYWLIKTGRKSFYVRDGMESEPRGKAEVNLAYELPLQSWRVGGFDISMNKKNGFNRIVSNFISHFNDVSPVRGLL